MTRKRTGSSLRLIAIGAGLLMLAACTSPGGGTDATPASEASESPTSTHVPDPCRAAATEEWCRPIAGVDLEGSGNPAGVALSETRQGRTLVRVALGDRDLVHAMMLGTTSVVREQGTPEIAFHDLTSTPGAEIVVATGMKGSTQQFQVFDVIDGELRMEAAPGWAMDITAGSGVWTFPGERMHPRVLCRDSGQISLGVVHGADITGIVKDFRHDQATLEAGEASHYLVSGPERSAPAAEITDMSIGSTHFKCADLRMVDLADAASARPGTTPARPVSHGPCDSTQDMLATVRNAIGRLPRPQIGTWSDTAAPLPNPCAELSYSTVTIDGATNSSPTAVILFSHGAFIGPASDCFAPVASVDVDGDTAIVTYRYAHKGESNAGATGRVRIEYTWTGTQVVKKGSFPEELKKQLGCDA
ncbi:LppP/LprE family lipoprotein [Gordonia paraffinivorans]|uniref:LppP/LprE family lipoprotein n=1 Tax=Gordonia paraffinivorans TaxID=175628 RepID=UPI001445DD11|nr:LppP/LprE family lipoprotein [Gordonia paraffinivorans]